MQELGHHKGVPWDSAPQITLRHFEKVSNPKSIHGIYPYRGKMSALDAAQVTEEQWQGPYESRYGMHLVMLRERNEPYTLSFDDVRGRVIDDYRYKSLIRLRQEAEQRVVSEYEVVVNLD